MCCSRAYYFAGLGLEWPAGTVADVKLNPACTLAHKWTDPQQLPNPFGTAAAGRLLPARPPGIGAGAASDRTSEVGFTDCVSGGGSGTYYGMGKSTPVSGYGPPP